MFSMTTASVGKLTPSAGVPDLAPVMAPVRSTMSIVTSWPDVLSRSTRVVGAGSDVGAGVTGVGAAGAGVAGAGTGEAGDAPVPELHAARTAARAMAPSSGTIRDRWLLEIILVVLSSDRRAVIGTAYTRDEGPPRLFLHRLRPVSAI